MCRLAAYLGPEITLAHFLLQPRHSLLVQARQPQELRYTTVNADGFGYGWYAADQLPAAYTSPLPIWSDVNLQDLGRSLRSDLWLAIVRSDSAILVGPKKLYSTHGIPYFSSIWREM